MVTEIAKIEPLPMPAPTDPAPRLPAWLGKLSDGVAENWQLNPTTGKHGDCLTLPPERMPTASQRLEMETHKQQLAQLLEHTPAANTALSKKAFALISKMLLAKPSRAEGAETVKARAETYQIALFDVPVWATEMAIRKWYRFECNNEFDYRNGRETFDYRWAPESADLRRIALRETHEPHRRIEMIDRILNAVPYQDRTAEQAKYKTAISALMASNN